MEISFEETLKRWPTDKPCDRTQLMLNHSGVYLDKTIGALEDEIQKLQKQLEPLLGQRAALKSAIKAYGPDHPTIEEPNLVPPKIETA